MLELQVLKIWNHPILNFEHVRRGGRIKGSEAPRSKLAQARVLSKGLADFQGSKSSLSGPALIFMVSWHFIILSVFKITFVFPFVQGWQQFLEWFSSFFQCFQGHFWSFSKMKKNEKAYRRRTFWKNGACICNIFAIFGI